jgi:hypothetical protein
MDRAEDPIDERAVARGRFEGQQSFLDLGQPLRRLLAERSR